MVSIVVLAHNESDLTTACLLALQEALDGVEAEVICVDNGSDPVLAPLLPTVPRLRRIRHDDNPRFATANNRVVPRATGDILLFLNNDVMLGPDSVRALIDTFARHADVGVVGARLDFPGDRGLQHAGIVQMLWGLASNYGSGGDPRDARWHVPADRFAVTGACLAIRRSVFTAVGGFDARYRWGYEDVDLCLAVRTAGWRVFYDPAVTGTHHESATLHAVRRDHDVTSNYALYRQRWEHVLRPREDRYCEELMVDGIRRVVVIGTGAAGRALTARLTAAGLAVVGVTSTGDEPLEHVDGHRYFTLDRLGDVRYDRLVAGTQFFFAIEHAIAAYDPTGAALFPAIW